MCCYLFFHNTETSVIDLHMITHRTKRNMIICISVDSKLQIFGGRRSQILYQCIPFFNLITYKMVLYIFFIALRSLYIFRLRCRIAVEHAQQSSGFLYFSFLLFQKWKDWAFDYTALAYR